MAPEDVPARPFPASSPASPSTWSLSRLSVGTALVAAVVYVNALDNPFVYDDLRMVVENTSLRVLSDWRTLLYYEVMRPAVNLSYAVDAATSGLGPFGFHRTNVLLHVLNVWLLARLAWHLTLDASRVAGGPDGTRVAWATAAAASLLLAVHPVMASAVGYVAARSEVLCATGVLLALLAGRRWLASGQVRWAVVVGLAWVLALASKEVGVLVPVLLLFMDALVVSPALGNARPRWRQHAVLVGVTAVLVVGRLAVLGRVSESLHVDWDLLPLQFDVARRYVGLLVAPAGQTIFHAVPLSTWTSAGTWVGVAIVVGVTVVAWLARRRVPSGTLGAVWFLSALTPSMALVLFDRAEPMAEHRLYTAGIGAFLAAGAVAGRVVGRVPAGDRLWNAVLVSACVVLVLMLGARTVLRNVVWSSAIGVWREAVGYAPDHWVPHQALGESLLASGRLDDAVAEFQTVIRLRPETVPAYQKLALAHLQAKRPDAAIAAFDALRTVQPTSPEAAIGLGAVALLTGRRDEARRHFEHAVALDPGQVPARQALAEMAEQPPEDFARALALCEEIAAVAPGTPGNAECLRRNRARVHGR